MSPTPFVADEVRAAVGEPGEGVGGVDGVGTAVDDDAERGGAADGLDMAGQALLSGLGEIRREEQDPVGAGALRGGGELDSGAGAVAGRGEDRGGLGRGPGRGADDLLHLAGGEREELAGAARGEQAAGLVRGEPGDVVAVGALVEGQVGRSEVGHREGQQPGPDATAEFGRGEGRHLRTAPEVKGRRRVAEALRRRTGPRWAAHQARVPVVYVAPVQARAWSLRVMPRPGREGTCIRPSPMCIRSLKSGSSQSKCSTQGSEG